MLRRLSLENVAIMETVEVVFDDGLTAITGETGAGKSLLISAIALVFGKRVSPSDVLRQGARRGRIELAFDMAGRANAGFIRQYLNAHGVELFADETEVLVSREFSETSSRARINGSPVPLDVLNQLRPLVVDLHGQHELTSLFDEETHGAILDAMGDEAFQAVRSDVARLYGVWADLSKQLAAKRAQQMAMANERDYLTFQLSELDAAGLESENEDESAQLELKRSGQGEQLKKQTLKAYQQLSGDAQQGVADMLEKVQKILADLNGADPVLDELIDRLAGQREEVKALAQDLRSYHESVTYSPQRIDELVERLDQLEKLKRKHGPTLADVIAVREEIRQALADDERVEEDLKALENAVSKARTELEAVCSGLSRKRQQLGQGFTEKLTAELQGLELPAVRFQVHFQPLEALSADGAERAIFLFSANPGEPVKPLSKVVSGGELSRILLAIKVVTAEKSGVDTLVFDEIDTGISGPTAKAVAERLQRMARHLQVIAITHQPILAAYGEHHLHVEKIFSESGDRDGKADVQVCVQDVAREQEQRMRVLSRLVSGVERSGHDDDGTVESFVQQLIDQADESQSRQDKAG